MGKRRAARKALPGSQPSRPGFTDTQIPIGNFILLKGKYWGKHCAEGDEDTDYRCLVQEYSACQTINGFRCQAYRVVEKGVTGDSPEGDSLP